MKEFFENFFDWWRDTIDWVHCFMAGLILFAALMIFAGVQNVKQQGSPETYAAWCKATKTDISYEEWQVLRRAGLLPGQVNSNPQ